MMFISPMLTTKKSKLNNWCCWKEILYFKFTLKMYFTNTKSNYFTYIKDIYLLPLRIILFRRQLRGARPDNPICERRVGIQYSFVLLLYYYKQSTFPSRKFSYGNFMISHSIWKNDLAKLMNMKHLLSGVAQAWTCLDFIFNILENKHSSFLEMPAEIHSSPNLMKFSTCAGSALQIG